MEILATPRERAEEASRRLSPVDAAFLYLERKEIPLAIASVFIFDGPISFDQFLDTIASRLHLIPRYRQVVVMPSYNLGYPTWEDDPNFDIRRHIFRVSLDPPGGEAELEDLAGRIFSQLLDRSKPLWECYVVEGLQDGRGAVIVRVHHSLADGIAGVALIKVLLDASPDANDRPHKQRHRPRKAPPAPSLIDAITSAIDTSLQGMVAAEVGLFGLAQDLLSNPARVKDLAGALPELAASVERLPFNKPCTGDRKFCWAQFDIADMAAIRDIAGATINDVILSVLTRALARYVKLHHQTVVNRYVRIVCPVNLRHGEQNGDLGNQISFMPVALPLDVSDPLMMLKGVAARTEAMKRGQAADVVALLASCIAAAPPPLQALFWWGIPQITLPVPLFNMICTNIPGSRTPLYSLGRRLIAAYPQVPTGYELGINVAVHSYEGKLFFGLIADAHVAPDVRRLRDFLYVSFRELYRSTGIKKAAREPRPRKQSLTPAELVPSTAAEPLPQPAAETAPPIEVIAKAVA
jgi:diacylglycerol O-acyltransferase / wax synthase